MRLRGRERVSTAVSGWLPSGATYVFTPALLSPVLWLDASDTSTITEVGGAVSQWSSKVGSYDAVQPTAANQPTTGTVTQNGLNAMSFGADDAMSITSFDMTGGGQKFSVWAVYNATRDGNARVVMEHSANWNNNQGGWIVNFRGPANSAPPATGPNSYSAGKSGATTLRANVDSAANVTDAVHVWVATHDGTLATDETSGFLDGTAATIRQLNNNTSSDNRNDTLFIGARAGSSLFLNGPVCELGVTLGVLTTSEREDLASYLKNKWGTP